MLREKKGIEYFIDGFNCAEATLLIGCDILNINNPLVPRIASCFGGGINGTGNLCGLYTGAMMAIGIKYGRDSLDKSCKEANDKGREFHEYWMSTISKLNCHELLDLDYPSDLIDPKEKKAYSKEHKCVPMCKLVATWLEENL